MRIGAYHRRCFCRVCGGDLGTGAYAGFTICGQCGDGIPGNKETRVVARHLTWRWPFVVLKDRLGETPRTAPQHRYGRSPMTDLERRPVVEAEVIEMWLCEAENVYLKPGRLYRFNVDSGCERCRLLAAAYPEGGESDD